MDAAAILKATTGNDAMITRDTRRRILDAVDANFDAELATTADFVSIPSTRGAEGPELAHENDMANNKVVVTAAITRDVIAGLDAAIHLARNMLCRSLMNTRVPSTPTAFV
jgi:hypothetical protein